MFPGWLSGKGYACQYRRCGRLGFHPWVGGIPQKRKWQPTPVFLPGKFHGQRSLVCYIVHGGHKLLDTTEQLNTHTDEGDRSTKLKESHREDVRSFFPMLEIHAVADSILVMPLSVGSPDWARKVLHPGPGCGSAFSSCSNSVTVNI